MDTDSSDGGSRPPTCIPPPPSPNPEYMPEELPSPNSEDLSEEAHSPIRESDGELPLSPRSVSPARSVATAIISSDDEREGEEPVQASRGRPVSLPGSSRGSAGNSGTAPSSGSKFWAYQPVMKIGENSEVSEAIMPILPPSVSEPSQLPRGMMWVVNESVDEQLAGIVSSLVGEQYVQDRHGRFDVRYGPEQVMWTLQEGGEGVSICIMDDEVGKEAGQRLIAFISAIPITLSICGEIIKAAAVNLFCIRKQFREQGLAPLLMKELIRQMGSSTIYQGVFTVGLTLPLEPVSKANYYHRPLDIVTLVSHEFYPLGEYNTLESETEYYNKRLQGRNQLNFRPIEDADFDSALELVNNYLQNYEFHRIFTMGEFKNTFKTRNGVVYTFVTVTEGRVTDLISYYIQTYGVLRSEVKMTLKMATGFMNVATSMPLVELFRNALVFSKNNGCHGFTVLNIMKNNEVFEELGFVEGTGDVNYYMYNWRCPSISPGSVGLVIP